MKSFKYFVFSFICIFMLCLSINADELEVSNTPFVGGTDITVNKVFDSSAFIGGKSVDVNGNVEGISFIGGDSVKVSGTSEYSIVGGNVVELNSRTSKDAIVGAYEIKFKDDAYIGRDAYFGCSILTFSGTVERNVKIYASSAEFKNTTIYGDVTINSSSITIGENVSIVGKFKYNEDAVIEGKELLSNVETYKVSKDESSASEKFYVSLSNILLNYFNYLLLGLLLCLLFNKSLKKINKKYENMSFVNYAKQFGHGFLVLFVTPLLSLLLITTSIGMSVGLVLLAIYIMFIYISRIILGVIFGNMIIAKLFKKKDNIYLSLLLGVTLITILVKIPYLGGIASFILLMLGLGICYHLFKEKDE